MRHRVCMHATGRDMKATDGRWPHADTGVDTTEGCAENGGPKNGGANYSKGGKWTTTLEGLVNVSGYSGYKVRYTTLMQTQLKKLLRGQSVARAFL